MSAEDLVQRCLQGDQPAWSAIIDRYAGLVYAIARAHGLDEPTCDDVAQSVFAALTRHLPKLKEPRAVPGWLATSTRRECWRIIGSMRRERGVSAPTDSQHAPPEAALAAIESAQRVREALADLGGRCQKLLMALYLAESNPDYQTISRTIGIPVGSIGPTRARCLAKLAEVLGPDA